MARTYAKLKGSIWRDDDWRQLPAGHQRLYLLLFSQPEISNCGVLPYLPAKWAGMAPDTTVNDIEALAADLQEARFIVVDHDTYELLIRTYVKHDKILEQPSIRASAVRQYDTILSNRLRTVLSTEYPDAFQLRPHEQAICEPYAHPGGHPASSQPAAFLARGHLSMSPATRQPSPPPITHQQHPAAKNADAAEDLERLRAAGWTNGQLDRPDLDRAAAWLDHYENDPTAKKPAALAWQRYSTTDTWPERPRTEIAPGATSTRSTSPPLRTYVEPDIVVAPAPPEALALLGRLPTNPAEPPRPEPPLEPTRAHDPDPEGAAA